MLLRCPAPAVPQVVHNGSAGGAAEHAFTVHTLGHAAECCCLLHVAAAAIRLSDEVPALC